MNETVEAAKGRVFVLVALRDYTRKDGTHTQVKVWQSTCKRCGEPFEVSTPLAVTSADQSHAFKLLRCEKHRAEYSATRHTKAKKKRTQRDGVKIAS